MRNLHRRRCPVVSSPRPPRPIWSVVALLLAAGGCDGAATTRGPSARASAIIGGVTDSWHASVVGVDNVADSLDCDGIVISPRTVVTVAHCPAPTRIFIGTDVLASAIPARTEIAVVQRVVHPAYTGSPDFHNDLALLQLASDAPVQPSPLLRSALTNTEGEFTTTTDVAGPSFTAVGYGYTAANAMDYGRRRAVVFPIHTVGPATFTDASDSFVVDQSQFFYKSATRNQCSGDSGGATFLVRDHVERLAGVLSLGDPACEVGFSARTDADVVTAFIQPTLDAFESGNGCRADGKCDETCNTGKDLVDPDCAAAHCKEDGVCAYACVLPADPDCPSFGHCATDGVCDKSCTPFDTDCLPACAADGVCLFGCPTADPDCAVPDMAEPPLAADMAMAPPVEEGCAMAGRAPLHAAAVAWALAALGLAALRRRLRHLRSLAGR